MTKDIATYITMAILVPLAGKIIWDWLKNGKKDNEKNTKLVDSIKSIFNDSVNRQSEKDNNKIEKFKDATRIIHDNQSKILVTLNAINESTKWLKEIHDNRDDNGVPLWFYPKGLHSELIRELEDLKKELRMSMDFLRVSETESNVYITKILDL